MDYNVTSYLIHYNVASDLIHIPEAEPINSVHCNFDPLLH